MLLTGHGYSPGDIDMVLNLGDNVSQTATGAFVSATGTLENTAGLGTTKRDLARALTVARERGVQIQLEKVEDLPSIMSYGIMSTPGSQTQSGSWIVPLAS